MDRRKVFSTVFMLAGCALLLFNVEWVSQGGSLPRNQTPDAEGPAGLMRGLPLSGGIGGAGQGGRSQIAKEFQGLRYLFSPPSAPRGSGPHPVVVFLHGAGESGTNLDAIKIQGVPYMAEHDDPLLGPFIAVSPQCPSAFMGFDGIESEIVGLVKEVTQNMNGDASRVYLTGVSMGGFGTWDLGSRHPDIFAAVVPVCGWVQGSTETVAKALVKTGVWVAHGANDVVIPVTASDEMVEALKKSGREEAAVYKRFEISPPPLIAPMMTGHNAWDQTYSNPELWDWLLSHRLAA